MASRNGTCSTCGNSFAQLRRGMCRKCGKETKGLPDVHGPSTVAASTVDSDLKAAKLVKELISVRGKYGEALKTIEAQQLSLAALRIMQEQTEPVAIEPRFGSGTSEACPVVVASDWHSEEIVNGPEVSGLNVFNPVICERRVKNFFQAGLRLIKLLNVDVKINTVVLALLGDFITGELHGAENAEKNAMGPCDAIVTAQNLIIGGIDFWLNNSPYNLIIVCKVGNHGRTTLKTRFSSENSHSLEYLMYCYLQAYFSRTAPERVRFVIDSGYHSYLPIYDKEIRFHHGHALNYGGGIGGLTIPANKAVAGWNQGRRSDFDIFGHFHQRMTTRRFACNGSLIGYNGYALSIKAEFEPPQQSLLLFDKKRGKTCEWPILLER